MSPFQHTRKNKAVKLTCAPTVLTRVNEEHSRRHESDKPPLGDDFFTQHWRRIDTLNRLTRELRKKSTTHYNYESSLHWYLRWRTHRSRRGIPPLFVNLQSRIRQYAKKPYTHKSSRVTKWTETTHWRTDSWLHKNRDRENELNVKARLCRLICPSECFWSYRHRNMNTL